MAQMCEIRNQNMQFMIWIEARHPKRDKYPKTFKNRQRLGLPDEIDRKLK